MSVRIEIKSLEEAICKIEELGRGLKPSESEKWAKKIEEELRAKSPQKFREKIKFEVIKTGDKTFNIVCSSNREMIPIIKEVITQNLGFMPIATQEVFKDLMQQIIQTK